MKEEREDDALPGTSPSLNGSFGALWNRWNAGGTERVSGGQ